MTGLCVARVAVVAALVGGDIGRCQAASATTEPVLYTARFNPSQTYYLEVPGGETGERSWPLVIVIHGGMASGLGDFKLWRPYAVQEGFILLAPNMRGQYHLLEGGSDRVLVRLVEELSQTYRIDRSKVLLAGFSWGGQFAYRFAMKYPAFAHTVAILNAAQFPPSPPARGMIYPRFYLAVGAEERVALAHNGTLAAALRRAGYPVELLVARGVGHSIPSQAIVEILARIRAMQGVG
ncbi:MAG: dienelactone hydrolase family protein [Candidatus Omnitrophota bacterium]|nr:dienelactone hydrolase family protein [Candidatus Omnitrophota bacterium]